MITNRAKLIVSSLALAAMVDAHVAFAGDNTAADAHGFLIGIDAGKADARKYCHNVSDCDHADTSVRGDIGYQFNQNWSAELGYTSFGTLFKSHDNDFNASQKANAWTLSAIGTVPLGDRFGVFGRVGAARYETNGR